MLSHVGRRRRAPDGSGVIAERWRSARWREARLLQVEGRRKASASSTSVPRSSTTCGEKERPSSSRAVTTLLRARARPTRGSTLLERHALPAIDSIDGRPGGHAAGVTPPTSPRALAYARALERIRRP